MLGISLKGKKISNVGLGTVQFGMDYGYTKRLSQPQVDEILNACRREGVNFLDTARDYGDSEAKIGSFLKRHQAGDWIIATKIKHIPEGICSNEAALSRYITSSVRASIKLLGRPFQILQLHNAEDRVVKSSHLWKVIAKLKRQGLFQEFGVSFYDPKTASWVLERYSDLVSFIQAPFNVFDQRFLAVFKEAKRRKISVISRSTFLRGLIPLGCSTTDPVLKKLEPYSLRLNRLAQKAALTVSEIAFLFSCSEKKIDSVLIGVKSASELNRNIKSLKKRRNLQKIKRDVRRLEVKESKLIDPRQWPLAQSKEIVKKNIAGVKKCDFLVLLQARMGSTRLPGKIMKSILGQPMLLRQIERISRSKRVSRLVVATTVDPTDDLIEKFCRQRDILFFRGSIEDVLDRFFKAALLYKAKYIVRITADCPLIDPDLIDRVIAMFQDGQYDYIRTSCRFPDGLDVEVFSMEALERAFRQAALLSEREHVTPFIYKHPDKFRIFEYQSTDDLAHFRWTVDQKEDLDFIRSIYRSLYLRNPAFTSENVLELLRQRPELLKINAQYKRNEGYLRSLKQDAVLLRSKRG